MSDSATMVVLGGHRIIVGRPVIDRGGTRVGTVSAQATAGPYVFLHRGFLRPDRAIHVASIARSDGRALYLNVLVNELPRRVDIARAGAAGRPRSAAVEGQQTAAASSPAGSVLPDGGTAPQAAIMHQRAASEESTQERRPASEATASQPEEAQTACREGPAGGAQENGAAATAPARRETTTTTKGVTVKPHVLG